MKLLLRSYDSFSSSRLNQVDVVLVVVEVGRLCKARGRKWQSVGRQPWFRHTPIESISRPFPPNSPPFHQGSHQNEAQIVKFPSFVPPVAKVVLSQCFLAHSRYRPANDV